LHKNLIGHRKASSQKTTRVMVKGRNKFSGRTSELTYWFANQEWKQKWHLWQFKREQKRDVIN